MLSDTTIQCFERMRKSIVHQKLRNLWFHGPRGLVKSEGDFSMITYFGCAVLREEEESMSWLPPRISSDPFESDSDREKAKVRLKALIS